MINNLTYSKTGLALTERFESCRLGSYQDVAGVWTIGWGHTNGVVPNMICDQAQADLWLQQDTQWAANVVNRFVTVQLTQEEFDAICDFVFNVGSNNFRCSTLLRLLNSGDYQSAANEFERWSYAGGVKVAGLLRRRNAEESEFNS